MLNKPTKVLIGKDISWNAAVVGGATLLTVGANSAEGEVIVFDKGKKVLAAGSTIADTDTIYIGQVTGTTYNYTTETGSLVTGTKKIIFSDPIEGHYVKNYTGKAYTATSQQVTTFTCTNLTVTAGTELLLKIVYHDLQEQKGGGQFIHAYRYICPTGATVDTAAAALAALVNKRANARVVATLNAGSDYLILTGQAIPSCTSSLDDIDEYVMVRFNAYLTVVQSSGNEVASGATQTTTAAVVGNGTWTLTRDAEKEVRGYKGFTNQTNWPILKPDWSTVKNETYDEIVIEHSKSYIAPDNLYTKQTPIKTIIFVPNNASANQMDSLLAVLNPWMASTAGTFAPVGPFTA